LGGLWKGFVVVWVEEGSVSRRKEGNLKEEKSKLKYEESVLKCIEPIEEKFVVPQDFATAQKTAMVSY
jgi:hypothetical protein